MKFKIKHRQAFLAAFISWTILANSLPIRAQGDITTSEDISGGSSVFVFRQSRKAPQTKSAYRNTGNRSAASKAESRRKLFAQTNTIAKNQRPRVKAVDPNTVAISKPPKANGGKTGTPPRQSNEQISNLFAGGAETYLERKDYNNAVEYFNQALQFNPKNANAKLGLSDAYTGKADETSEKVSAEAAIPFYLKAVEASDKNAAAYAGLGDAYDSLNDSDNPQTTADIKSKALTSYEKALALNPGLTEIYAPLGVLYYQKGEIAKADDYLTKASAANPADADARYYLGLVRFKQNRNDEAIAALTQAVKTQPDSAEAHYYLGASYDRLDRKNDAIAEYNQAVKTKPDYADAWFDLGVTQYNQSHYQEAADAYSQVVRLKNSYGQAYFNLAECYRQLGMSIAYEPNQPATNAKRTEYFALANGKYELAETFIKTDADLYSNWAFCLARVAKFNLAIDKLNKAVALNPDATDYSNLGWAYYNAAQVDSRVKKDDAAAKAKLRFGKAALQKATQMNPNFKAAFLNLGVTSTDLGDYQDAVNALKTAVDLQPDWLPANNELGLAYRQLNDLDNAVKYFKKTTELDDKFAAGWYNLGEAEYRRGNIKEAKKAQDKLKKLNPNLANSLQVILSGAVLTSPGNNVQNKIQQNNPLNKVPKLPF